MVLPIVILHGRTYPVHPDRPNTGNATATVTGTAAVGSLLTGTFNNDDPEGPAIAGPTYQWIRGTNTTIGGATSSTYTATITDLGSTLKVRVTYTDFRGNVSVIDSAATSVVAPGPDTGDATASLSGTAQQGQTLTATFNNNDPDGAAISGPTYQWFRGSSTSIGGATSSTYVATGSDVGSTLKCRVNYTDGTGNAESIFTANSATVVGVTAGTTQTFTTPGVGSYTVPNYNVLREEVWSAAASGQSWGQAAGIQSVNGGNAGGASNIASTIICTGGNAAATNANVGAGAQTFTGGTGGTSSGGGSNFSGANGGNGLQQVAGSAVTSGAGGNNGAGANGAVGVSDSSTLGSTSVTGNNGTAPGGGGSGGSNLTSGTNGHGAGGGGGAYSFRDWVFGAGGSPVPGASRAYLVGAGGTAVSTGAATKCDGGNGANGQVKYTVLS